MKKGLFVVFEGLDRCGKSTQVSMIYKFLISSGFKSSLFKFPSRETESGVMIDKYLKNQVNMPDQDIHLMFTANRREKMEEIESKINEGHIVICDRYSYSGIAYSSSKDNMDYEWCKKAEEGLLTPDVVIYLAISCEKVVERKGFAEERYEILEFQKKVKKNYERLIAESAFRWNVVDAERSIDEIHEEIVKIIQSNLLQ